MLRASRRSQIKYSKVASLVAFGLFTILLFRPLLSFEINCSRYDKSKFRDCIYENHSVGTSATQLHVFLTKKGFSRSRVREDNVDGRFAYLWRMNLTPYGVLVKGRYDESFEILEIEVF